MQVEDIKDKILEIKTRYDSNDVSQELVVNVLFELLEYIENEEK